MRIATFNVENLDDEFDEVPLEARLPILRPTLERLDADLVLLQEVNAQRGDDGERRLAALDQLIEGTRYEDYHRAVSTTESDEIRMERNLVTLSRYRIDSAVSVRADLVRPGSYTVLTGDERRERDILIDRPLLHCQHVLEDGSTLHTINLHLKSKRPNRIAGAQAPDEPWKWVSVAGWAEGYFLSSMQRVTQALELRLLVDQIFDADDDAQIVVGGDFNSDLWDVPMEAVRGRPENLSNPDLAGRAMLPVELSVAESARWSLIYQGRREMIDHLLVSRSMIGSYRSSEVHNETVHDESIAFAFDSTYLESDHAAVVAEFNRS